MLVMLALCICLAALVAYLISKVNELEVKTSDLLKSGQTFTSAVNDVLGGLQGKQLWDAWQVVVSTSVDEHGLDRDRDRLMMLLSQKYLVNIPKLKMRYQSKEGDLDHMLPTERKMHL